MSRQRRSGAFPTRLFAFQLARATGVAVRETGLQVVQYKSRKHATVLVQFAEAATEYDLYSRSDVIVKHFTDQARDSMAMEKEVLAFANQAGLCVPRILEVLDNFLILEFIKGPTLIDVINATRTLDQSNIDDITGDKQPIIDSLAAWLGQFHETFEGHAMATRRGDANLRNFILSASGGVAGLDFEEACVGDPLVDVYEILDSLFFSSPGIFTAPLEDLGWKFDLCEGFLTAYLERRPGAKDMFDAFPDRFMTGLEAVMGNLAKIRELSGPFASLFPAFGERLLAVLERLRDLQGQR
jgi:tRNA A-37 threonylcarbamoyl transferase component Bud32